MLPDSYSFFVGFGIFVIAYTSYFTFLQEKFPLKKAALFIALSFLGLYFFSKGVGALGFWMSTGDFYWSPASVMGFYTLQVVYWRPWAAKQGSTGRLLQKRWSLVAPIGLATGRIGCHFAGCCYIKSGLPLSWPLLDAAFLGLLALYITVRREELGPEKLYKTYLYAALGGRFFLDFLRGDLIRGSLGIFSFSQLICVLLILWLFLDSPRRKGHNRGHEIRSRKS